MIDNIDVAYCMAQLENKIREKKIIAEIYLDSCDGVEGPVYERMISRWAAMIDAFEAAFGVTYFRI